MYLLSALLCAVLTLAAGAQQAIPLHNGQQVTLNGTLALQPAGRLHFVTVKTSSAYTPKLSGEERTEPARASLHTIGLSGYNRYDLLYTHRGQSVTVSGKVMTDNASPYYLNHLLVNAYSIRLRDGTDLMGKPRARVPLAVDVGEYRASVVLPADLGKPWQYSAQGHPDADARFLSCSSNGGGDVVNCSCAEGFRAIQAESATLGVSTQVFDDPHTAQFGVGDDARRIDLSVTCSR